MGEWRFPTPRGILQQLSGSQPGPEACRFLESTAARRLRDVAQGLRKQFVRVENAFFCMCPPD
jgi:hypothetical protein